MQDYGRGAENSLLDVKDVCLYFCANLELGQACHFAPGSPFPTSIASSSSWSWGSDSWKRWEPLMLALHSGLRHTTSLSSYNIGCPTLFNIVNLSCQKQLQSTSDMTFLWVQKMFWLKVATDDRHWLETHQQASRSRIPGAMSKLCLLCQMRGPTCHIGHSAFSSYYAQKECSLNCLHEDVGFKGRFKVQIKKWGMVTD